MGALLAQRAIAESRRLGVKYVNVRPVARNLEAIRFFHRQGFRLLGRFELSIALEGACHRKLSMPARRSAGWKIR
jgi:L-amino acid N-acyltransferase YncA